ncbi:MAG: spermidine synthase [Planctomycetaceae bacterium]
MSAFKSSRISVVAFAATIFLSAFLLFQVQPLLSKFILPWFGGSPAVWTTCMLFFQSLLFGGYAYAHLLSQRLSPRWQMLVHSGLIFAALCLLPVSPSADWKPTGHEDPTVWIILLLGASVGLPFFILSSTGPLLQSWFARTHVGVSPYRLYALSNIGSLLALVSYPFAFEPAFDTGVQSVIWSWGFGTFGVLCAACGVWMSKASGDQKPGFSKKPGFSPEQPGLSSATETAAETPTWGVRLLWFLLAMAASVMLLATTNQVCLDVASVPFLWVLPLTLYLLTFILCFDGDKWYAGKWLRIALAVSILGVCVTMMKSGGSALGAQVTIYFAGLFFCCMVCHGELAKLKPEPRHLTSFYLLISAGGAAGGLFVGVIAPRVFSIYLELHIALLAVWVLVFFVFFRDKKWEKFVARRRWASAGMLVGVFLISAVLRVQADSSMKDAVEVSRNFYGVLRVQEKDAGVKDRHRLRLVYGQIVHGVQFVSPEKKDVPTTYYGYTSGVGLLMKHLPGKDRHIGLIGLGVGTLAAYARPGDRCRFYEINKDVIRLANRHFRYLRDCKGTVTIVHGDARLALEREESQKFDVLVVDAFSGDAIPTHLLSKEAFDVYRRHLKKDGVLAFHISNLYFDLRPVVSASLDRFGWKFRVVQSDADGKHALKPAIWMVAAKRLDGPAFAPLRKAGEAYDGKRIEWTDTRSNLIQILR